MSTLPDLDLTVRVAPEARRPPALPDLGPQTRLARPATTGQDMIALRPPALPGVGRQGAESEAGGRLHGLLLLLVCGRGGQRHPGASPVRREREVLLVAAVTAAVPQVAVLLLGAGLGVAGQPGHPGQGGGRHVAVGLAISHAQVGHEAVVALHLALRLHPGVSPSSQGHLSSLLSPRSSQRDQSAALNNTRGQDSETSPLSEVQPHLMRKYKQ